MLKTAELVFIGIALSFFLTGAITSLIPFIMAILLPGVGAGQIPSILYLMCAIFFIIAYVIQVRTFIMDKKKAKASLG